MPYYELVAMILERSETPPLRQPAEYQNSWFSTGKHAYICSNQGTEFEPKWRWFTA